MLFFFVSIFQHSAKGTVPSNCACLGARHSVSNTLLDPLHTPPHSILTLWKYLLPTLHMRFRESANCPSKAHTARKQLQNLVPSLRDSKTVWKSKSGYGKRVSSLKKKKKKKSLIANTLWFPRYSFCSTSVNRKYIYYRVIASLFCNS